jgi:outer membrane biosynthesis protein TonB
MQESMMQKNQKSKQPKAMWFISIGVALVFLSVCLLVVKVLLSDDGSKRRRQIQMVTLIKPPPPPKIVEKPPEPEIEEKEEIIEPEPEEVPEEISEAPPDDTPAGEDLGLDAEGTAGNDAFGLVGKKGGRALLAGSGDRTLMQRYAWYTRLLQEQIRKKIDAYMSQNGGIPKGEHKALVQIVLDNQGRIVDFKLHELSGNEHVDQALRKTLLAVQIDETPPEGMPKSIKLKISSRG